MEQALNNFFSNLFQPEEIRFFKLFFLVAPLVINGKIKSGKLKTIFWISYLLAIITALIGKHAHFLLLPIIIFFGSCTFWNLFKQLNMKPVFLKKALILICLAIFLLPLADKLLVNKIYLRLITPRDSSFLKINSRNIYFEDNYRTSRFLNEASKIENIQHQRGFVHPKEHDSSARIVYQFHLTSPIKYASLQFIAYLFGDGNYFKIALSSDGENFRDFFFQKGDTIPHYHSFRFDLTNELKDSEKIFIAIEMYSETKNSNPSYSHMEFFKFEAI
jgi:hypothetical protein